MTPKHRIPSVNQSFEHLDQERPVSVPKQAFGTPRADIDESMRTVTSDSALSLPHDLDLAPGSEIDDNEVVMEMSDSRAEALDNMKAFMMEEEVVHQPQKTLESLRTALRTMSSEQKFRDVQLERTVSILSLASQIAQDSVELGILPDEVFEHYSRMGSREKSGWSMEKGSAVPRSRQLAKSRTSRILEKDQFDDEESRLVTCFFVIFPDPVHLPPQFCHSMNNTLYVSP